MTKFRYKKLASGKFSIYTETYIPETQKRKYHFLKLYVCNDYGKVTKISHQDIPVMEQALRMIGKPGDSQKNRKPKERKAASNKTGTTPLLLTSYISASSKASMCNKKALLGHLSSFTGDKELPLEQVDRNWVLGFERHLASKELSEPTINSYIKMLAATFNSAVKEKLIPISPLSEWTQKRGFKRKIQYLNEDELNILTGTPVPFDRQIKDAFLFSCYAGLRYKDLQTLTIGQVTENLDRTAYYLHLNYSNSDATYYIALEGRAKTILQRHIKEGKQRIFDKLSPSKSHILAKLKLWSAIAGIEKEANFTMARDTFATNQLKVGVTQKELAKRMGIKTMKHLECYHEISNWL